MLLTGEPVEVHKRLIACRKQWGVLLFTVSGSGMYNDIMPTAGKLTDKVIARIRSLHSQGWTPAAIRQELDLALSSVYRYRHAPKIDGMVDFTYVELCRFCSAEMRLILRSFPRAMEKQLALNNASFDCEKCGTGHPARLLVKDFDTPVPRCRAGDTLADVRRGLMEDARSYEPR